VIKIVCSKGITTQRDVNTVALLAGSFIEDEEAEGGGREKKRRGVLLVVKDDEETIV
jgi:hypothetical protein